MQRYSTRNEIEAVQWFPGVRMDGVKESDGCAFLENGKTILPGQYIVKLGGSLTVVPEELFCIIFQAEPVITDDRHGSWRRDPKDEPRD